MIARVVLASLAIATAAEAQDTWADAVQKANTHKRYAVRRAVANKIARAGDEAVPALRAYEQAKGRNEVSMLVIDSIARVKTNGDATIKLLEEWSDDRTFYWRALALSGLARREMPKHRERFIAALDDPSHLFRIHGAIGLIGLGEKRDLSLARRILEDPDPRARLRIACELAMASDDTGYETMIRAFDYDGVSFLGDPWGDRDLTLATKTLIKVAGRDFAWREARSEPATRRAALERMRAWAAESSGREMPKTKPVVEGTYTGGTEVRSCRHGDLFVRWDADGVTFGLLDEERIPLSRDVIERLERRLQQALDREGVRGRVVCDFLRLGSHTADKTVKAAPNRLPESLANWLVQLARAVEEAGDDNLSAAILARLPQFVEATDK